jgi:hypothetical protein
MPFSFSSSLVFKEIKHHRSSWRKSHDCQKSNQKCTLKSKEKFYLRLWPTKCKFVDLQTCKFLGMSVGYWPLETNKFLSTVRVCYFAIVLVLLSAQRLTMDAHPVTWRNCKYIACERRKPQAKANYDGARWLLRQEHVLPEMVSEFLN